MIFGKVKINNKTKIKIKCDQCGEIAYRENNKGLYKKPKQYCSLRCAYAGRERKKDIECKCDFCNKIFIRESSHIRENNNFCSQDCYYKWKSKNLKGTIDSSQILGMQMKASKNKVSKTLKEGYVSGVIIHGMLGKHHSEESKKKISNHHIETGCFVGEKNPMYGKKHSKETRDKMSEIVSREIISGKRKPYGKNGHMVGKFISKKMNKEFYYRSSWEKVCFEYFEKCDEIVLFDYECLRIPYYEKDEKRKYKRWYIPDFLIEYADRKEIWEIKPKAFQDNEKTRLKTEAALQYCKENNIKEYCLYSKEDLREIGII